MNNHSKEQLALFGKNRYHDWAVLFLIAVVITIVGIAYDVWLYTSTAELVLGTDEKSVAAPSQFDAFKEDVDFLSSYIEEDAVLSTSTIPRNPSLR